MERERDKQETLDQIQYELLKRDANQDQINQMKVNYQQQALNEWEANLKAKNLKRTLHSNVDRLQYEIIHGKFQNSQSKNQNSQLKMIDGDSYNPNPQNTLNKSQLILHEGISKGNILSDQVPLNLDGNRFQNFNKKNLNSCNFLMSNAYGARTPKSMYQENFLNSSQGFRK